MISFSFKRSRSKAPAVFFPPLPVRRLPAMQRPPVLPTLQLPALLSDLSQLSLNGALLPRVSADSSDDFITPLAPPTILPSQQSQSGAQGQGEGEDASLMAVQLAHDFLSSSSKLMDSVEGEVVESLGHRISAVEREIEHVLEGIKGPEADDDGGDDNDDKR